MSSNAARIAVCAACGASSVQSAPIDASADTPPDFDTRPGEPLRSTILSWMNACPHCGYAADRIDDVAPGVREFVLSATYQEAVRERLDCAEVRPFLCHSLILEHLHSYADAGWCALQAAWVADDAASSEELSEYTRSACAALAVRMRTRAIEMWKLGKANGSNFMGTMEEEFTVVTDLYRRIGDFEEARVACTAALDGLDLDAALDAMLRVQLVLIAKEDTTRHSMAELMQPSAEARPVVL